MSEKSLFTRIIEREIPAKIEYEDDRVIAIWDIHPKAPTHLLFILKEPVPSIQKMEKETMSLLPALFMAIQKVAAQKQIGDYRLVINNGAGAGQTIFHLHVHFLAQKKFSEEKLGFE